MVCALQHNIEQDSSCLSINPSIHLLSIYPPPSPIHLSICLVTSGRYCVKKDLSNSAGAARGWGNGDGISIIIPPSHPHPQERETEISQNQEAYLIFLEKDFTCMLCYERIIFQEFFFAYQDLCCQ